MDNTFKLYTFGCKVNQYESQLLRERLFNLGIKESQADNADIYIINTCTVTHRADRQSYGLIRRVHKQNPLAKIFVTGCSAENSPDRFKDIEGITCVVGNSQKEHLSDFIFAHSAKEEYGSSGDSLDSRINSQAGITEFQGHTRAFIKIQDGCNNSCSYCIVPKVRGPSRSRPLNLIKREAEKLAANGYKEIVLCGICLGSYGRDLNPPSSLHKVIEALEGINGLLRIRLSSIEASDINVELIEKLANSNPSASLGIDLEYGRRASKLCRHLHIPFQNGDDKILRLMNRSFNSDGYLKLVYKIRRVLPDVGITTDIMVGFPEEDDKSFNNTVRFLREAKPSRIHIFSFSPRNKTAAFNFNDRPNKGIVKERVKKLQGLAVELSLAFHNTYIGRSLSVLIESTIDSKTGLYRGYSDNYIKVFLSTKNNIKKNTLLTAKVIRPYQDGVLASLQ